MFTSQFIEEDNLLTADIKISYSDVKLVSETPLYHLYEGKSKYAPNPSHTIRAFNFNSDFAKENFDAAATLFIKELLYLVSIDPKCVLINSFEINDQKMTFAALSYAPLSCQIQKIQDSMTNEESKEGMKPIEFNDIKCIENMISDLLLDVEFLSKEMKITDCSHILVPNSIYKFKESGAYFVGDWLTALMSEDQWLTQTGTTRKRSPSLFIPKEMLSLGLSILELNGEHPEKIKSVRVMNDTNHILFETTLKGLLSDQSFESMPKELKKLLERMMHSNVNIRPRIEEFKEIKSARRKRLLKEDYKLEINIADNALGAKDLEYLITKIMTKWVNLNILNLQNNKIDDEGATGLSKNTSWTNLTTLNLSYNKIGGEGATGLSKNTSWTNLTTLNLSYNNIGGVGATGLSKNTSWTNLTTLDLDGNNIGDKGATGLSKNTSWTSLTTLDLDGNNIGDKGATGLSKNTSWTNLTTLNLGGNQIGGEGATGLSKNTSWTNLTTLNLCGNKIGGEGATGLSKNTSWTSLTTLNLSYNKIGDEGATGLSKNTSWTNLTTLYLSNNNTGDEGATRLSKNTSWTNLTALYLYHNNIGDEGARGLSKNTSWTNLTTLSLSNNNIGDEGATGLSKNTSWTNLTTLDLSYNNIGDEGARGLSKNTSWTNLTTLRLQENKIGTMGARGLSKWTNLATRKLRENKIGTMGATAVRTRWPHINLEY